MTIYMAKTLTDMKMFGPTYDLTQESEDKVEQYRFGFDINEWILDCLVDSINSECGTILDDGDYDFLNVKQCEKLYVFLQEMDMNDVPKKCHALINKLSEYAQRAILYNTGIAIEL